MESNDFWQVMTGLIMAGILGAIYFIPAYFSRGRVRFWQVFWINLLLGWSLIWWVVALVIALDKSNEKTVMEKRNKEEIENEYIVVDLNGEKCRILKVDVQKIQKLKDLFNKGLITEEEFLNKTRPISQKYIKEEEQYSPEIQLQDLNTSFEKWELTKEEYESKKKKAFRWNVCR